MAGVRGAPRARWIIDGPGARASRATQASSSPQDQGNDPQQTLFEDVPPTNAQPHFDTAPRAGDALAHHYRVGDRIIIRIDAHALRERQLLLLRERLDDLVREPATLVAIGLDGAGHVAPSAWRVLGDLGRRCAADGGRCVVFGLDAPIRQQAEKLGLTSGLMLVDNAEEALAALHGKPAARGSAAIRRALRRSA